jgi:hypothetical protein
MFTKAPKFSGESATLERYFDAFELYCLSVECPPELRARMMTMGLPPKTTTALRLTSDTKPATYDELRQRLRAYFYGSDQAAYHSEIASTMVQEPGESIDELATRLQQAVRLANSETMRIPLTQEIYLYAQAITDEYVRHQLSEAQQDESHRRSKGEELLYPTFQDYVALARRKEHRRREELAPGKAAAHAPTARPAAKGAHIALVAADPAPAPAAPSSDAHTEMLQKILQAISAQPAKVHSAGRGPGARPLTARFATMRCFNCNMAGHGVADCPKECDEAACAASVDRWRKAKLARLAAQDDEAYVAQAQDLRAAPADAKLKPASPVKGAAAGVAAKPPLK